MKEKMVIIEIDEQGNASMDLDGFRGKGCADVAKAFQGSDRVKSVRNKPEFYMQAGTQQQQKSAKKRLILWDQPREHPEWLRSEARNFANPSHSDHDVCHTRCSAVRCSAALSCMSCRPTGRKSRATPFFSNT